MLFVAKDNFANTTYEIVYELKLESLDWRSKYV